MSRMFSTTAVVLVLLLPSIAFADPSDSAIRRDVGHEFSGARVSYLSSSGGSSTRTSDGWEFRRTIEFSAPTQDFPGIRGVTKVERGDVSSGSSNQRRWTYQHFAPSETRYEGVPNPAIADVVALLESRHYADFYRYLDHLRGPATDGPRYQDERPCIWNSPTAVVCNLVAVVNLARGPYLQPMRYTVAVRMTRPDAASPLSAYTATIREEAPAGERRSMPIAEINAMPLLRDILSGGGAPVVAIAPPGASATANVIALSPGFTPSPHDVTLTAGGAQAITASGIEVPSTCTGYITAQPTAIVRYAAPGGSLAFEVDAPSDTTMMIRQPDGTIRCDDDSHGQNPALNYNRAAAGQYEVWIGAFERGTVPNTQLRIREL